MVSKNNQWQHLRAAAQQLPHYGLRKLSVGVASVLLSTTLYMGVSAHADTVATPSETTTPARVTGVNSSAGETTGNAAGSGASEAPVSQTAPGNSVTTPEKPVVSAADAKVGSEVPSQPVRGMSATSANKRADTMGFNSVSSFTPKLKLLASQPVTESPDTSDVNVDLTNYWKQPADMTKATSAGGHTEWLDNGPNYVDAKVTDFKATMYADNATLSTKDWYRIGYQIGFDVDAVNLQPGKILHLFRLTQTSDTGYLPMLSPDSSDIPVQWNGKNLGTIHTSFHNIKTRGGDNLIDYFDVNLEITAKLTGVGNQHITLNVPWNNIINYYRPYSWRGAPETNKVTLIVTNNDFKYTKASTWKLAQIEYSPMTGKDNWGELSYLPVDTNAQLTTYGTSNIWFDQHPLVYVDTDTAKAFYNSGAKMPLTITDDTRIRGGYHLYTTNGNKLVLDGKVGDTTPLRPGRVDYPIVLPDGTVTSRTQDYDNNWNSSYPMPGANLGLAEIVNQNLTLPELKALNKTGLVVSAQDDGSINAYLNISVATMRQYDTPANRQHMYNELVNKSIGVNYSNYAANPTELKQLLKNTADYYFNGPTKGLPLSFGVNPSNLWYHLANLTEPTKVNVDSIEDQNLATGAVVERRTNTYTPNLAKIAGQSAVRFHYVSGFNGVELQTGNTATGKPASPVTLPTFPTIKGYTRRTINTAGTVIKLDNGMTMNLPADGQVLVDGNPLNFGAEGTWHDYYVVYDPVAVTKSYRFVDDTNSKPVGSDTSVKGHYQQTVKTGLVVPAGYKLAANQALPTQVTLDVDDPAVTLVHLIHQTTTVTATDPKANGASLPDNPNLTFNGVTAADLTKTVTRTIKLINDTPGGPGWFDTMKQEAHLTRTAVVDESTGQVTYSNWSTDTWEVSRSSDFNGRLKPNIDEIPETIVTGDTTDQTVEVHYVANQTTLNTTFTWTIRYVDEAGNQLRPDSVITHGYTRTDIGDHMGDWAYVPNSLKVTGTPNAGWHIDSPDFKFNQDNGKATFDNATWQAAAAAIDGYTPNYPSVAITDLLSKDPASLHAPAMVDNGKHEFTFHYTLNPKTVTINYVNDEDNEKVVGTSTVSGKPNTEITITSNLPKGYMLTPNKDVPSMYTVTDADHQVVTIHVQKQFVDLSDTDPQAKQTRTVTLHYVYGAGDKEGQPAFDDAVLDVYYHRTATLDRATNQTTYGDWMWDQSQGDPSTPGYHVVSGKWTNLPQSWATVTADVPSIKGWYADLGQNDSANINHVPANTWVFPTYNNASGSGAVAYLDGQGYEVGPTHTIKYMPNQTTVTVNYVDDDNNQVNVGSQHWDGTTGQHIELTLTPPENYVLTPGWVNPSSYDFDGVNSSWYTVHVKHATQDVTGQEPKDQVTKVTRLTRNHLYGDGPHKGEKFAEPDIFDVAWKRTATKDLVTDKVTFGDWSVNWDDSKSVQGRLSARPKVTGVDGMLYGGKNGYSYMGANSHSEFVRADGSVKVNWWAKYGWRGTTEMESYPVLNYYYGRGQVKISVEYVDFDTNQRLGTKELTGDDYLDGNTITFNKGDLTDWSAGIRNLWGNIIHLDSEYQLYAGQRLPATYKIDTLNNTISIYDNLVGPIKVYVVQPRTVQFTFVDNDSTVNGQHPQVGDAIPVTGITGSTTPVSLTVPAGYKLAEGQQLPTTYTLTKGETKQVVALVHQHATVQSDASKTTMDALPDNPSKTYPTGVSESDLNKIVTRTININKPDGSKYTEVQTVKLTRTADVDEVTGAVKYSDWTTGEWRAYLVQSLDGYTASQAFVAAYPVDESTKNQTVEVHYDPMNWQTKVNYVDVNGNVIHTTTVNGVTDQTVLVPNEVPTNWQLVSGQTVPSEIKFGVNGHEPVTVKIEHQVKTVQGQKTIMRTINYVDAKGTQLKPSTVQTLSFTRTGVQDLVTKVITWNSTPNQSFAAVNDLAILGYKPDITTVPAATVNWDDQDSSVDVHYQVANSTVTVNLVDATGHIITTMPVTGQVGSTVDLAVSIPDGWMAYNKDMPTQVVIGNSPTEIDYLITHRLAFVKSTDDVNAGDLIPGTKTKTFNDKVTADNLVTHASYRVNIWADAAHTRKLATKTYHADFVRDALVDAVTGDVYYYDWSEGGKHVFAGFTRQAGNGYQAVVVPAWTATQADPTKTVDLVAQPEELAGTIQYQTMDGKVVATQAFMSNNAVTLTAPKGYTLMTNETVVTPTADKDQTYVVYVRPAQTLYTAADKLPDGIESLSKVITRTIHITEANGHVRTITQRVHFTRTATVKADGSIVYSAWRATGRAVWNKVFLPKRHGYHVVTDNALAKLNVMAEMRDIVVNVKYVKD